MVRDITDKTGEYSQSSEYRQWRSRMEAILEAHDNPLSGPAYPDVPEVDFTRHFGLRTDTSVATLLGADERRHIWPRLLDPVFVHNPITSLPKPQSGDVYASLSISDHMAAALEAMRKEGEDMANEEEEKDRMSTEESSAIGGMGRAAGLSRTTPYEIVIQAEIARGPGKITRFISKYGDAINRALVSGAKLGEGSLYSISAAGFLEKTWNWQSAIHTGFLESTQIGDTLAQNHHIIHCWLLRTNPHLQEVFDTLVTTDDLTTHRHLLRKLGYKTAEADGPVLYALHPPWPKVADLAVDEVLPVYVGQTQNGRQRHRGHMRKPINRRVAAQNLVTPLSQWENDVIAEFDDTAATVPTAVLLLCEHFLLSAFRVTDMLRAGLNVNIVDRIRHDILIPTSVVKRMLQSLDRVIREYPDQRLPVIRDLSAWYQVLQPVIPSDNSASIETFIAICLGSGRKWVWEKVQTRYLQAYLKKTPLDDEGEPEGTAEGLNRDYITGFRPTSLQHTQSSFRKVVQPFGSESPLAALEALRQRFVDALRQIDAGDVDEAEPPAKSTDTTAFDASAVEGKRDTIDLAGSDSDDDLYS